MFYLQTPSSITIHQFCFRLCNQGQINCILSVHMEGTSVLNSIDIAFLYEIIGVNISTLIFITYRKSFGLNLRGNAVGRQMGMLMPIAIVGWWFHRPRHTSRQLMQWPHANSHRSRHLQSALLILHWRTKPTILWKPWNRDRKWKCRHSKVSNRFHIGSPYVTNALTVFAQISIVTDGRTDKFG